ncbi:hypothetical protein NE237_022974 [Protea cynaroides]|uniref:Uncharacterized protein n=1 Tax=Protea cynaroides TaxID=273540 RepID=A0A9Q0K5S0_9MAGN|nr:hypothetical protein NE237_022974 [Protea cynaroides]
MESMSYNEVYEAYHHLELCCRSKKTSAHPQDIAMRCQEQIRQCLGNPTASRQRRSNRHRIRLESGISYLSVTNRIRHWSFCRCTIAIAVAPDHRRRHCYSFFFFPFSVLDSLFLTLKPSSLSNSLFFPFLNKPSKEMILLL